MKRTLLNLLALSGCLSLLSCDPMQRYYNSETWVKDIREASTPSTDSMNRAYCAEATVDNELRGINPSQFTYAELIKQGIQIRAKEKVNIFVDSLNKATRTDIPLVR